MKLTNTKIVIHTLITIAIIFGYRELINSNDINNEYSVINIVIVILLFYALWGFYLWRKKKISHRRINTFILFDLLEKLIECDEISEIEAIKSNIQNAQLLTAHDYALGKKIHFYVKNFSIESHDKEMHSQIIKELNESAEFKT